MTETVVQEGVTTRAMTVNLNGETRAAEVEPRLLLVHVLVDEGRDAHRLGDPVPEPCRIELLADAAEALLDSFEQRLIDVREVPGRWDLAEVLQEGAELHPIQEAFREEHGLQCGFCTPGMMLTATALLKENPDPTDEEIRWALSGNICRCTGYQNIVNAVHHAAAKLSGKGR